MPLPAGALPRRSPMQQYGYGEFLRSDVAIDARARFITRTYNHLFGAIIGFTLIEVALFKLGVAPVLAKAMMGTSWLLVGRRGTWCPMTSHPMTWWTT